MKIAFDIDDTIIVPSVVGISNRDTPNYETIALYKWFQNQWNYMILWSGSWNDWASHWNDVLWLNCNEIRVKEASEDIDICFDDCDVKLAKVNVKVKRVNNSISRAGWNKTKRK